RDSARDRRVSLARRGPGAAPDPRHATNAARVRVPDPDGRALQRRQRHRHERVADLRAAGRCACDDARPPCREARRDRGRPGVRLDALAAPLQGRAADRAPVLDARGQPDDPPRHGGGGRRRARRRRRARPRRGHRLLAVRGRPRRGGRSRHGADGDRPRPAQPVEPRARTERKRMKSQDPPNPYRRSVTMNERRWSRRGRTRLLAVLVLVVLAATAVALSVAGPSTAAKSGKPTIVLATNSWEGSLANNVVAQYVIEKNLGYKVNLLTIDEDPAWPAMAQGKLSAVLEEWGHSNLYAQYIKGSHKVADAGLEGPDGNIGWYVPTYLVKAHPELKTWKGVKKDWKLFVTPQSSPQGQFLDGSPSYVTNDVALVKNLGINLKVVFAGTEAAQLTEIE